MKSVNIRNFAGQAKLNGKKSKSLNCGCCVVIDFRFEEKIKESNKIIKDYKKGINE